jgi:hypothetical protein
MMSRNSRIPVALTVLAFAMTVCGCGADDGFDRRYTVSGQVTYNGQPLKKGKIYFIPEDATKRQGTGEIEDGAILKVTTVDPGDGLFAGKYKVMVSALDDVAVPSFKTGVIDQVVLAKAEAKAKSLIPKKYSNAIESGLTVEISSSNRTLNFELKD